MEGQGKVGVGHEKINAVQDYAAILQNADFECCARFVGCVFEFQLIRSHPFQSFGLFLHSFCDNYEAQLQHNDSKTEK